MSDYEELKSMLERRKAENWLTVDCLSIKQLLGLIAENESLRKDAERYRSMRSITLMQLDESPSEFDAEFDNQVKDAERKEFL